MPKDIFARTAERLSAGLIPKYNHNLNLSNSFAKLEWISASKLAKDSIKLASLLPPETTAIAGIPRSGMIPASIIATLLHLPLYQLSETGEFERLGNGSRGKVYGFNKDETSLIAVIDDTTFSGRAIKKAKEIASTYSYKFIFNVVYYRENSIPVDNYVQVLNCPHLLEWNIVNNVVLKHLPTEKQPTSGVMLDIDGIIVHDKESGGKLLSPYLVPRTVTAPILVTGRQEKLREETEKLLLSYGAKWDKLIMMENGVNDSVQNIAEYKADIFSKKPFSFFLESCPKQAEIIFKISKKPVICPVVEKIFQ